MGGRWKHITAGAPSYHAGRLFAQSVPFDDANNKYRNSHDDSRYRFITFKLFFFPIILIAIETRRSDASRRNVNVFSFPEQIPS